MAKTKNTEMKKTSKFIFKQGVNAFLSALILSFGIQILVGLTISKSMQVWSFLIAFVGFAYWMMYKSDSIRRIWGRTLAGVAIMSFISPVAVFIFGAKFTAQQTSSAGALGAAAGTGFLMIIAGFFAFFIGTTCAISAYFIYKSISRPVTIENK